MASSKPEPGPRREFPRRGSRREAEGVRPEEQALLTLLSQGRIPADMVKPGDFSREINQKIAKWLLEGRKFAALLSLLEDDGERAEAMRAVSYEPIPEEREDCLMLAQTSLKSLQRSRLQARQEAIEEELRTADPTRKAELFQQLKKISQAIEED